MKLAINFNGEVSVCCVDWSHETTVGDVNRQSLFDIWNGDALRQLRRAHLCGNRQAVGPCASCDYILGLPEQYDLDDKAAELLEDL